MTPQVDAALLFPPQWSPFQPPLSLPSLKSWLEEKGFTSHIDDLNIRFYDWLLSDEASRILKDCLLQSSDAENHKVLSLIFDSCNQFRADVARIKVKNGGRATATNAFVGTKSFDTYLRAVSQVQSFFTISPYTFSLTKSPYSSEEITKFVENPPRLIKAFVDSEVTRLQSIPAGLIGLSCIGQEQLIFTLLIGKSLKALTNTPIVVGGTILSRMFKRGVLPTHWIGRYFDIIVKNEGEKPLEQMVQLNRDGKLCEELHAVFGIVFLNRNQEIVTTDSSSPLKSFEVPTPDFDGLPLGEYFSPELTLPVLSSRGCYWGKCEFCHHGMVYGEKYSSYDVEKVHEVVRTLSDKYGCHSFAFNDEAIPPKLFRSLGKELPPHETTNWIFTGLIKFEKYFSTDDFSDAYGIGFRSLYVGLESASERVLNLMRKNSTQEIMLKNLVDARKAGIWMHCFAFFGFPGESVEDARITFDFLVRHVDIIGSIGCGTFSLEHDAPIQRNFRYKSFGLKIIEPEASSVNVYYDYDVDVGLTAAEASVWMTRLNDTIYGMASIASTSWIPREHLLPLLRALSFEELRAWGERLSDSFELPPELRLHEALTTEDQFDDSLLVINRLNMKSTGLRGHTRKAAAAMMQAPLEIGQWNGGSTKTLLRAILI
jgi:anaerobic magnesium-protoporphyrin IX monomethyl ester cyclase